MASIAEWAARTIAFGEFVVEPSGFDGGLRIRCRILLAYLASYWSNRFTPAGRATKGRCIVVKTETC